MNDQDWKLECLGKDQTRDPVLMSQYCQATRSTLRLFRQLTECWYRYYWYLTRRVFSLKVLAMLVA
jgi:hypothetical protein